MVGSISQKLLTELGMQTEDAECKLMGEICYFANKVLIIKVVWVSTIPRQAIDTLVIKMTSQYKYASLNLSNLHQNGRISYLQPILLTIFVKMAPVKSQSNLRLLHFDFCSYN